MAHPVTRILLVEDNPGDATLTTHALIRDQSEAYQLEHVASLADALARVRCDRFDLVLLDLDLPDSSELGTLTRLIEANASLPIVVLSGQEDEALMRQAVRLGAQDYLRKDELVSQLDGGRLPRVVHFAIERNDEKLRLSRYALYDEVTELPTRRLLRDRWLGAKARAKRKQAWIGVLVIDLDGFKAVNDSLGHAGGDRLLRVAAERLANAVRRNDTVARVGGDEFVVLLETIRGIEDAREVAEKLRVRLGDPVPQADFALELGASIGIGVCQADQPDDLQDLIDRADLDMYREKKSKARAASSLASVA